jgi:LPXTG-motif cell wall-anchored protein
MHAYVRRALCAVGLTGGIVLLGVGLAEAASADGPSGPVTSGEGAILSGNQTGADVQAPIDLSGNQVTVIGQDNKATSTGAATTSSPPPGSPTTSGEDGGGSGNQTTVIALVPVDASGNQVTVIGQGNSDTAAGSSTASTPTGTSGAAAAPVTSGQDGIGSGNQTGVIALVPVDASGNQVTVIGQDNTVDSTGSSTTSTPAAGSASGSAGPVTSGQDGIGSGNQTGVVAPVPVDASGNQVTVIGQDNLVTSSGSTTGEASAGPGPTTTGAGGIGSGNQTPVGATAPVGTSGNQVTVIGQDNTDTSTTGGTTTGDTPGGPAGGGTTTPPAGTVSPPSAGTGSGATGSQAVSAPVDSALPNTGAGAHLLGAGLLGLLAVLLGGALVRREDAVL